EAGTVSSELAEPGEKGWLGAVGEDETWLGAELSGAQRERGVQASGDRLTALAKCTRQDENRVGAAHFRVDRDGLLTGGGEVHQRAASFERAGEAYGADQWMTDQNRSDVCSGIEEQRKCPG